MSGPNESAATPTTKRMTSALRCAGAPSAARRAGGCVGSPAAVIASNSDFGTQNQPVGGVVASVPPFASYPDTPAGVRRFPATLSRCERPVVG